MDLSKANRYIGNKIIETVVRNLTLLGTDPYKKIPKKIVIPLYITITDNHKHLLISYWGFRTVEIVVCDK